jgi:hypothetical protein
MQWLDYQHQQYMTSAASRHVANSLCLVLGPMQASCCAAWILREPSTFQRFTFEDFKLWTPELNSPKDLIPESRATPNRCTYLVPLFDHLSEKALSDFMPEYLISELSIRQIHHRQGRSRSPSTYSLAKHSGAAEEDWYLGYHLAWTWKTKGGVRYDSAHHPEDSRGPWRAPQGVDNNIYKIYI